MRLAEDALAAARGAKGLIEDQAHYARRNVANAQAAVRSAALKALAAEELEGLITAAVAARADLRRGDRRTGWLIRHRAAAERRRAAAPAGHRRRHRAHPLARGRSGGGGAAPGPRLAALEGTP